MADADQTLPGDVLPTEEEPGRARRAGRHGTGGDGNRRLSCKNVRGYIPRPNEANEMKTYGMPETFWVVTKPSPLSETADVCFPCTFERLLLQGRGGLHEDDIVSVHADETDARRAAARLLGDYPVRPQDATFAEVVVHVMLQPKDEELTARDLGEAAVEAVLNAMHGAEEQGHRYRLKDRVSLGMSQAAELGNLQTTVGG